MDCTEGNVPSTTPRGFVIASTLDIAGAAVIGHIQIDSRAELGLPDVGGRLRSTGALTCSCRQNTTAQNKVNLERELRGWKLTVLNWRRVSRHGKSECNDGGNVDVEEHSDGMELD